MLVLAACPDVKKDTGEGPFPTVEFDPANAIVPFPNNLVLDPMTGRVALPAQACESPTAMAVRTGVLNQLDGFGTFETTITVTLTDPPDPSTLDSSSFVLYKLGSTTPIPAVTVATETLRADASDCTQPPAMIPTVALVPMIPLDEHATYVYAVLDGLKPLGEDQYYPSSTWALVRQTTDPVTVDGSGDIVSERTPLDPAGDANDNGVPDAQELVELDQLWKAHQPVLAFLDTTGITDRSQVLVAGSFTTQTTTDPLDPSVATSPAAMAPTTKLGPPASAVAASGAPNATAFLTGLGVPCGAIPCASVGDVLVGGVTSPSYQVPGANSLTGGSMIPGAWSDPENPAVQDATASLTYFAFIPTGAPPAGGWPLVIFGHGLGSSKESLAVFGPQLAKAGFASIAIDFQASGSRAIAVSADPALGCAGTCSTTKTMSCVATDGEGTIKGAGLAPTGCPTGETCINGAGQTISATSTVQCYAPILSSDLGTTRDNIRQTILDLQRVKRGAIACGPTGCTSLNNASVLSVDPDHIVYAGISLGGIIGTTTSSVAGFNASVLNVPGVGLVDILENTANLTIRCTLVNSLIDAGIVTGAKWDPSNPTVGECTTDDWKMQASYQQFASTARWVLDPADGANFAAKLAARRFLIMEVVNDQVVPNIATNDEGALVGLTPGTADPASSATPPPSGAITTDPLTSKWVRYMNLPADPTSGFPGNTFAHASLLEPANDGVDGELGTARVQTDAITYLLENH
ncbi:MAG TPA: hypothetical protein VLX92_00095 [Kofleriaceae bacterium]|nr:hypothetical protein [Kofleriaceae bacterium]